MSFIDAMREKIEAVSCNYKNIFVVLDALIYRPAIHLNVDEGFIFCVLSVYSCSIYFIKFHNLMIAQMRILTLVCLFLVIGCNSGGPQKSSQVVKSQVEAGLKTAALELSIQGMTCTGCEQTIQSGLSALKGVKGVKANFQNGKAYVEIVPGVADTTSIKESIASSGYVLANIKSIPLDSLRLKR